MKISKESWEKAELYIISLWFLFFLIIVINFDAPTCWGQGCEFIGFLAIIKGNIISIVSAIILLLGVILYFRFDYKLSGSQSLTSKITSIENVNYEHLTFLTTYIIPLICFNLHEFRYILALITLLAVIGVIYVKTDMFYANPTLAILGYHIYKTTIETRTGSKTGIILITKEKLSLDDLINTKELDKRIYFARKAI